MRGEPYADVALPPTTTATALGINEAFAEFVTVIRFRKD